MVPNAQILMEIARVRWVGRGSSVNKGRVRTICGATIAQRLARAVETTRKCMLGVVEAVWVLLWLL